MSTSIGAANYPNERSSLILTIAFTDDKKHDTIPNEATWTLSDERGAIINSRQAVTISSLASSVTLVLEDSDLAIVGSSRRRVLTLEWTYDSDAGSDLPAKNEVTFNIVPLVNVS